jgi:hypothetical protein
MLIRSVFREDNVTNSIRETKTQMRWQRALAANDVQSIHKRMVRFQKLTRNLFLTLHGRNVHPQQRQLSKFLMRYQQFASYAYRGAAGPVCKIVFFNSADSDVLQQETTTFSLGHTVRRISHHAISFFGGSLKTAFTYHHCPCPSRNFVIG